MSRNKAICNFAGLCGYQRDSFECYSEFGHGLAETGITVNFVSPGPILTPGVEILFKKVGEDKGWGPKWEDIEKHAVAEFLKTPIPRFGRPEEVAAVVAFLSSPIASYITASNIRADGGTVGTVGTVN